MSASLLFNMLSIWDFADSSVGEESTCNAGQPGLIPGLGRSAGEGKDYPLSYSWASLVAQLVKNPPAMQETWVQFLGWEKCPGEGKDYPLRYSGLENSIDSIVHGVTESDTTERLSLSLSFTADITISAGEYVLIYLCNKHASL